MTLSRDEVYLLDWLAKQDGALPEACASAPDALEGLIAKDLVMVIENAFAGPLLLVTNEGWQIASGAAHPRG